jgi:hypothetical protein
MWTLRGFDRLGGRRLRIDGHLRIDHRRSNDGIGMRNGFRLFHHARVPGTGNDLRPRLLGSPILGRCRGLRGRHNVGSKGR